MLCVPDLESRLLSPTDVEALDELHFRCAEFFEMVEGRPPAAGDGLNLLSDRPDGLPAENKIVIGLFESARLIGAIDVLCDYPEHRRWYLGLLILAPTFRNRGLGAMVFDGLRSWVSSRGGQFIRLIVQDQNPRALDFWLRQGFEVVGSTTHAAAAKSSQVFQLELNLADR